MPANKELRAALLAKNKWTKQTLSANVQRKKRVTPMSTEEAVYLLAHEAGVKIDKYLGGDEVARVRTLIAQGASLTVTPRPTAAKAKNVARPPKILSIANKVRVSSTMLTAAKLAEAKEMSELYPILYVLENSMREVVKRVMHAKFGEKWWDTELVSGKLKSVHKTAADRMQAESGRRWHQRRGAHPIDYVDLGHLGDIIFGKQDAFFPGVLGDDLEWFRNSFMKELEPSRNVLCHMNPLSDTNARDLVTKLERWEALVRDAAPNLPST